MEIFIDRKINLGSEFFLLIYKKILYFKNLDIICGGVDIFPLQKCVVKLYNFYKKKISKIIFFLPVIFFPYSINNKKTLCDVVDTDGPYQRSNLVTICCYWVLQKVCHKSFILLNYWFTTYSYHSFSFFFFFGC